MFPYIVEGEKGNEYTILDFSFGNNKVTFLNENGDEFEEYFEMDMKDCLYFKHKDEYIYF